MAKDRRKAAIRERVAAQLSLVKQAPKAARDWRAVFLHALRDGASAKQAARMAGVSRSCVYNERCNRAFDDAWYRVQRMRRLRIYDVSVPIWPPVSLQRRG